MKVFECANNMTAGNLLISENFDFPFKKCRESSKEQSNF